MAGPLPVGGPLGGPLGARWARWARCPSGPLGPSGPSGVWPQWGCFPLLRTKVDQMKHLEFPRRLGTETKEKKVSGREGGRERGREGR